MKKIILNLLTLSLAGALMSAIAQDAPGDNNSPPPAPAPGDPGATNDTPMPVEMAPAPDNGPDQAAEAPADSGTNVVILPGTGKPGVAEPVPSVFLPPEVAAGTNNPDELRLNFRNAPLEMVLHYLSDAAGFIIVLDTRVNGNVNIISTQPVTRDEAVDLLNAVLNKNGYAAIRSGRTLTIVDKNDAKTRDIPVKSGNDPDAIPKNAEIVTQIIPVRFVDARQLVSDLTSFVSSQATVVANEAGNSIVITDTQQNIRHLTEIIKAIDSSAQSETEIRVFHLSYASPTDVATELASVFPSSSSGSSAPTRFSGGGGGGRGSFFQSLMGGGGGGGSGGGSSASDRIKKATQVTAVADARIQSVIVTAPRELMGEIAVMMKDLDVPSTRDQKVYVFTLKNGDPQQTAQVLQNMFSSGNSSRGGSSSSQNSALMQRSQNTTTTATTPSTGFGTTGSSGRGGGAGSGMQF